MRISKADLERIVGKLNVLANSPTEYMTDGKCNIGHYTVDAAYGGVQLQRIESEGGSVSTLFGGGYCTKRELYEKVQTFISGINYAKEGP